MRNISVLQRSNDGTASLNRNGSIAGRYSNRIQAGTVHASKGLETPCVYLFDGYTARVRDAYYDDLETGAEKHRLYYVGATQASKTLVVTTGYENRGTSVFPGFENGLPRDDRVWDATGDGDKDEGVRA